jgi:hypothetical protein
VVAIVRVGGIGKTALTQKVFNDEAIHGEFSKKIWLSVNKNLSEAQLLRRATIEAGGDHQPAWKFKGHTSPNPEGQFYWPQDITGNG